MKNLLISLLFFSTLSGLSAQDTPNCSASFLQLQSLEIGFTDLIAILRFTPQEEVITYDVQHDFTVDGQPMSEMLTSTGPMINVTLVGEAVHTFTALNRCTDGSTHTGSTFYLDFGQDSIDVLCPPPTNLVIDMFDPIFTSFHWDQADSADFWQVNYQPEGLAEQNFTVEEPFVEQVLEPTVRHTFSIYAVCDDQMFTAPVTQTHSPTVIFSLVIVEDVKLLPISCDSLTNITWTAYQMECTAHGEFGPNKEEFVYTHGCEDCLTATDANSPIGDSFRWNIYPNPVTYRLTIDYSLARAEWVHFKLYDLLGRAILVTNPDFSLAGSTAQHVLPIATLPAGAYWLLGHFGERRVVEKILIQ